MVIIVKEKGMSFSLPKYISILGVKNEEVNHAHIDFPVIGGYL